LEQAVSGYSAVIFANEVNFELVGDLLLVGTFFLF
jgi:hypothetical protein